MRIKNITPQTIFTDVWGRHIEIPANWGITEEEVGGKDALLFIAFKLQGQVEIYDDNEEKMEFVNCPLCGNVIEVAPAPKAVVIKEKTEKPVKAKVEVEVKESKKSRVKKSK